MLKEGQRAPDFCLPNQDGEKMCLRDFLGKWIVLFFYKHHFGLICGKTVKLFNEAYERFEEIGAEVIGIGASEAKLCKMFADFLQVKFHLLSDEDLKVSELYGLKLSDPEEKIVRATFLIDPDGIIRRVWYYEDVDGHVEEVLSVLRSYLGGR